MARVTAAMSVLVLLIAALIISVRSLRALRDTRHYKEGDHIPLFANTVYVPNNKCEAYPYFKLPFCPPESPIVIRAKSLEEVLEGDCFTNTLYQLNFKAEKIGETLCEKNLSIDEVRKFRHAVRNGYKYQMYYDNIQMRGVVGYVGAVVRNFSSTRYYLMKHINFHAYYIGDRVKDIYITTNWDTIVDITEDAAVKVNFTYSVFWGKFKADSIFWNETLRDYVWATEKQGQGFTLFSFHILTCIIVIWVRFLAQATVPYLRSYLKRYWIHSLQMHGDGCRCPPYSSLLGAILGIGIQQLLIVCFLFVLAYNGVLYTCNYEELAKRVLLIYSLTSAVAGYVATSFHTRYTTVGWQECVFQTGFLYLLPALITFGFFNTLAQKTLVIPDLAQLGTKVTVLFVWGTSTIAFLVLGGMIGYTFRPRPRPRPQSPCATSRIPRVAPQLSWYMKTPAQMILGGLLPFMSIFRDMDILYASLWKHKVCGAFSTMLIAFIILVFTTIIVGVVFTQIQLLKRDQQWWWRSVFRGGSTAIFMFTYGIYFYFRANIELDKRKLILFLGYNACVCYALFLILGTIGFYFSELVFRHMYREALKNE